MENMMTKEQLIEKCEARDKARKLAQAELQARCIKSSFENESLKLLVMRMASVVSFATSSIDPDHEAYAVLNDVMGEVPQWVWDLSEALDNTGS